MTDEKKYDVELDVWEHQAMLDNRMITSMYDEELKPHKKNGDFVTLRLTRYDIEDLTGLLAAEANHTKKKMEEELLGNAWEYFESALSSIKRKNR